MLLELECVGVHALTAAGQRFTQGVDALLESRLPAFEDAQSDPRLGAAEEGQVGGETLVLPGLGTGLVGPRAELLRAIGADGVDDARAARENGARVRERAPA